VRPKTALNWVLRTSGKLRWQAVVTMALVVSVFTVSAIAQKPVAALPQVYINTTYSLPTGGTTWAAHTSAQLSSAIRSSVPGDVIVLDAGSTYSGAFQLPVKSNPNHKWIYIISSGLANLPARTRVSPAKASSMAKIVTPNVAAAFQVDFGADHWRLAGLEITAASHYPSGCGATGHPHCFTYFLIGSQWRPVPTATNITVDRCYVHGSPTQDMQSALTMNWPYGAVVDSYISDVHAKGLDTQAVGSYYSPGPLKIVNNYLSAAGENIMFGGAGGNSDPVTSDIEIRNNYLYKPLSWLPLSVSPGNGTVDGLVEKNAFEVKNAQRVLFDSNTIENVWAAAQNGYAIVLTVRTSQSGDNAVVNDITITNNLLKNVVAGFNTLAKDDVCGAAGGYPNCHNAGSQARWNISDNLITLYDPTLPGGFRNLAIVFQPGLDRITGKQPSINDVVFQHNTVVSAASTPCWNSVYFSTGAAVYPYNNPPVSRNVWILDNVLCRQPNGQNGLMGTTGLTQYMGVPSVAQYDVTHRFYGNAMYAPRGERVQSYPPHNYATAVPFTYVNPATLDYQLVTPFWTDTSDGQLAGVNNNNIP